MNRGVTKKMRNDFNNSNSNDKINIENKNIINISLKMKVEKLLFLWIN